MTPNVNFTQKFIPFETETVLKQMPYPTVIAMDCVSSASNYYYDGANRDVDQPHSIFQYTISGEGCVKVGVKTYKVPVGHAFLINSHDKDTAYFYPRDSQEPWKFLYIELQQMEAAVKEINQKFGPVFQLPSYSPLLKKCFNIINSEQKFHKLNATDSIEFCNLMLSEILTSFQNIPEEKRTHLIQRACETIYSQIETPLTVETLAREMKVSREYLARQFKKELQISPLEFINRVKVQRCASLLRETSLSIKEIAVKLSLSDASQLARLFRRYTDCSPIEFRESRRSLSLR